MQLEALQTRFRDVWALAVAQQEDLVFVIAGGGGGLSLFTLLAGGRFLHFDSLAHEIGSELRAAIVSDKLQIFATSGVDGGIARLLFPLDALCGTLREPRAGGQRVSGTAGHDLLNFEAGADTLTAA